jgi:IS4 transposase
MLEAIFDRFVQKTPITIMVRGLMERILSHEQMDSIFEKNAQSQYTRELLFSRLVDMMSLVVCGIYPSVNAAYRHKATELNVSRTAVYQKLSGIELAVSAAVLKETSAEMATLIELMGGVPHPILSGYPIRILDGNCLAPTDHRLKVLRPHAAAALPGKSLVVLDPDLRLAINVFPCLDGYTNERALFEQVLQTVKSGELWIADRNMCTQGFLFGLHQASAHFLVREHKTLPQKALTPLSEVGQVETGTVFEQRISITPRGEYLEKIRRVVLHLHKPTRDGESEIAILTSLPTEVVSAVQVAELYRKRWTIETLFHILEKNFAGEIPSLGHPKAALFCFCLALVAYNILAVIRRTLGSVHGVGKIESSLSEFYLVDEIQGTYRGLMIAIEPVHWRGFEFLSLPQLSLLLLDLAGRVNLKSFLKQPRSQKQKKPDLIVDRRHNHVSTARLLMQAQQTP